MNWQQLEDSFFRTAKRLINQVIRENPDQTFYAIALHEYYSELDEQITLPLLAVNSLEKLDEADSADDDNQLSIKYNPADWPWRVLEVSTRELERLLGQLNEEANRSTQAHWCRTEKRFLNALARIVKRLYSEFKDHPRVSGDFVCFPMIEHDEVDLLEKSVPKKLRMQHFGEYYEAAAVREKTVSAPLEDRLEKFRENLWSFEDEVAALGADVVDFVIGELKSGDQFAAARLLARIGVADSKVIQALRREFKKLKDYSAWCGSALAILGDSKWLLAQSKNEATRKKAISGIVTPLSYFANQCNNRIALDYRPLESLLDQGDEECESIAAEELNPGSSFIDITREDVDEAIRGMQSKHITIRQHAICVSGERRLGKTAAKTLLPAIVERFKDPHANCRRLALIALKYWKATGKPYHEQARKLCDDPDEGVRSWAYDFNE